MKPRTDQELNYGKYAAARNILKASDVIAVFGTRLGESDRGLRDMIVEVAFEKIRNNRFVKLYYSAYKKPFRGDPHTVAFDEEAAQIFTSYLDDYGEMPGMRDDLENAVFVAGGCLSEAPDGKKRYFDPFHLKWLRTRIIACSAAQCV